MLCVTHGSHLHVDPASIIGLEHAEAALCRGAIEEAELELPAGHAGGGGRRVEAAGAGRSMQAGCQAE